MDRVKLREVSRKDYESISKKLNERLQAIPPMRLSVNLDNFFVENNGSIDVVALPNASAFADEDIGYYELVFSIDVREEEPIIGDLVRTRQLNKRTLHGFRSLYHKIYSKAPKSIDEIFEKLRVFDSDQELLEDLMGCGYDVRYGRYYDNETRSSKSKSVLYTHSLYSGVLKGQGLLSYFFKSLKEVIDFDDLEFIEVDDIIEGRTCSMFNKLRRKISNDDYLCNILRRKYVKSPFMRLFNSLGFRNMRLLTNEGYMGTIQGYKADELEFSVHEVAER